MKKRVWAILLILPLLTAAIVLYVNHEPVSQKSFVIGIVNPNPGSKGMHETFIDELQKISLQENWQLSFVKCENKETLDADLEKLVTVNPDLLLTITTPGTKKTQKAFAGKNIPTLFIMFDPLKAGVVDNLSQPGGNVTGIKLRGSVPKVLEWLLEINPEVKNIFVPVKFDTKAATMSLDDLKKAAKSLDVRLKVAEVNTKEQLDEALEAIPPEIDAIFLLHSVFVSTHAQEIAQAAISKKLLTAAAISKDQEGVLLSYSNKFELTGKQASRMGHLILQGHNPADMPVEVADFYFVINLKTAEEIGLQLSDSILAQADDVVR